MNLSHVINYSNTVEVVNSLLENKKLFLFSILLLVRPLFQCTTAKSFFSQVESFQLQNDYFGLK